MGKLSKRRARKRLVKWHWRRDLHRALARPARVVEMLIWNTLPTPEEHSRVMAYLTDAHGL